MPQKIAKVLKRLAVRHQLHPPQTQFGEGKTALAWLGRGCPHRLANLPAALLGGQKPKAVALSKNCQSFSEKHVSFF
jgi:hypothetical protein